MLPRIKKKTFKQIVKNFTTSADNQSTEELYVEMFHQQPMLHLLTDTVVHGEYTQEFKEGYCRGLLQSWHLLNQQSIINDLEE